MFITVYAYAVVKSGVYLVISLLEFLAILLVSYSLLAVNRVVGHVVHFSLVLIYNVQTLVMRFGGTFITLIMTTNLSMFQDLKGKFGAYIVMAIPLAISTAIPAKPVAMEKKHLISNMVAGTGICVVSVILFAGKYSPVYNLLELLGDYRDYRRTAELIGNESVDGSRFYRSEIGNYVDKPTELPENPNVILIFTEGLSRSIILDELNIMPNLRSLESKSLSFTNYYNHSFATFRGLIGQLYSGYQFDNFDTNGLVSLQSILGRRGYQTTFINTEPSNRKFLEYLESFQFDEVVSTANSTIEGSEDIYIHDSDAYELLYDTVMAQHESGTPFFTAIYTFGTHASLDSPDEKFGDGSNVLLNKFYNLDIQFGKFFEKFKNSDMYDDTILIFTTDHATYQDDDFLKTFSLTDRVTATVDEIPLYFYYKGCVIGTKDVAGKNSLDLAPTLLDYLDISEPNYFLGNSLFGEEKISSEYDTIFYYPSLTMSTKDGKVSELSQSEYDRFIENLKAYFAVSGTDVSEQWHEDYISTFVAEDCSTLSVVLKTKHDYQNVWMPTWSQENDQDDLVWYQAERISDGEWECTVDLSKHGSRGTYLIHVYAGKDEPEEPIITTTAYIPDLPPCHLETRVSENGEIVTISLSRADDYEEVLFPVWSETDDQDDLIWYRPRKDSEGIWTVDVKISEHCEVFPDQLIVHVYGEKGQDDPLEFLTSIALPIEKPN